MNNPSGALFGISHVKGLADAFKNSGKHTESRLDISPWSKGAFTTDEGLDFSYVVGWWDEQHIGSKPSISEEGVIHYPQRIVELAQHIPDDAGPIFFQLSSVDSYAAEELINLGPYDIEPKWDFSTDDQPSKIGRCPVRKSDVDHFVKNTIKNVLASCITCKYLFPHSKLYYIFSPPPVESNEYIIEKAQAAAHLHPSYMERYSLLLKYGIRPFNIRKKLIELANTQLKQGLQGFGIDYVDPPAECLLQSGALDTRYARDMHHGNDLYNVMMMKKISKIISG